MSTQSKQQKTLICTQKIDILFETSLYALSLLLFQI